MVELVGRIIIKIKNIREDDKKTDRIRGWKSRGRERKQENDMNIIKVKQGVEKTEKEQKKMNLNNLKNRRSNNNKNHCAVFY